MNIYERYSHKINESSKRFIDSPDLNEADLELFESKFNIELPWEFKQFYLTFNGCFFNEQYFKCNIVLNTYLDYPQFGETYLIIDTFMILIPKGPPTGGWSTYILPDFYPGEPDLRNIPLEDPLAKGWNPKKKLDYLTFGEANNHQGLLMIGVSKTNFGKIFFWHQEDDEIGNPHLICESFFQFLESMGSYDQIFE